MRKSWAKTKVHPSKSKRSPEDKPKSVKENVNALLVYTYFLHPSSMKSVKKVIFTCSFFLFPFLHGFVIKLRLL